MKLAASSRDPASRQEVLREIYLDAYPPTHAFAVISWGAAATSWLAYTLNSHPDIYCVHAANRVWRALGAAPLLEGIDYVRLIASQGHAHVAAGDVHGIALSSVAEIREALGPRFKAAVVIRDPLPRLRSQLAHFDRFGHHQTYDLSRVDDLIDHHNLTVGQGDYSARLRIHGVNMLNAIIQEVSVGPVFTSESLTGDPAALCSLVQALAPDGFQVSEEWCDRSVRSQPVNRHRRDESDALDDPWLREIIRKIVKPEAWELYARFGYETPS